MKKYHCTTAELVVDPEKIKNPYLRLSYKPVSNGDDNPILALLQKNVIIVVSGGVFTSDGKPDLKANYQWCVAAKPVFEANDVDLETFNVPVEPYYRLQGGEPVGQVLNTMPITTFAVEINGEVCPANTRDNSIMGLVGNATSRLDNGANMYITVAKLQARKELLRDAEKMTDAPSGEVGKNVSSHNPYDILSTASVDVPF